MKFTSYQTTHIGKRDSNQDRYAYVEEAQWACYVVADGLGGHYKGEIAAGSVCESIVKAAPLFAESILVDPIKGMTQFLNSAIKQAQVSVVAKYNKVDTQTTLAVAWMNKKNLVTAHIGDSRVYLLNKESVLWRTPDHTQVQVLFEKGLISEEDIPNHPQQNQLLNAINMSDVPDPDIFVHPLIEKDETVILCTDGFWGLCSAQDLIAIARSNGALAKKVGSLIEQYIALDTEECDNITVQVVRLKS